MLKDNHQLKDIIRNYKDVYTQNHVIHLVCSISSNVSLSNLSAIPSRLDQNISIRQCNNSTDVRRNDVLRRNVNSVVNDTQSSRHSILYPLINNIATDYSNLQPLSNQQLAMYNWLRQVHYQYMQESLQTYVKSRCKYISKFIFRLIH